MRHHHGTHRRVVQVRLHALRQRQPDGAVHVLAVDLRDLLGRQGAAGRLRQPGHGIDQRLHPDLPRHIAHVVARRLGAPGDRAPRAQHDDFLRVHLHPPRNWLKIQILY